MPEAIECRVCSCVGDHARHEVPEVMYRCGESFTYFLCSACGCLQIASIPEDLWKYYGEGYYSYAAPSFGFAERVARFLRDGYCLTGKGFAGSHLARRNPNEKLRILRQAGLRKDSRVLDVGSGGGYLLGILWDHGFKRIEGLDPFLTKDLEFRKGVWVRRRELAEQTGEWDLVMFHHSFEHMADPLSPLVHARRLLAPGGRVIVRIPVVDGQAWDTYKECWAAIDAPRHLHLHSHKSFAIAAEKAGLAIVNEIQDSDSFQFWASELARKGEPQLGRDVTGRASFDRATMADFAHRAKELNRIGRGDQTGFVLKSA